MLLSQIVRCLVAILALTVSTAAQVKPKIEVLATGGTIAGAQATVPRSVTNPEHFPSMI
jgi:L-asparaginase/Glu-tRNA(Gln) amidotransferase subunit D